MSSSSTNARGAALNLTDHRFPWKWNLADLPGIPKNGKTVFSCFSCGGGSSVGYKLAGYDVIGNCEIDPRIMAVYKKNHHPRFPYLMDIRDFLKAEELPPELFKLDILDGSPPCSVFSVAGDREKAWGKEKTFREGQKKQRLDDLFFHFIDVAKRLAPKVVIAENVTGLIKGNARGYVNEIFGHFKDAGYNAQLFVLNSAYMGVPQQRERCVFVARRRDLGLPELKLKFNEPPILFRDVRDPVGKDVSHTVLGQRLKYARKSDKDIGDISMRLTGKDTGFNALIIHDGEVCRTIPATAVLFRFTDRKGFTDGDYRNCSTFPQDYDFMDQGVQYICGMSVPPVMMAQVASQVYEQWLAGF